MKLRTILLSLNPRNPRKKIKILKIKVAIKIKNKDCELFIKERIGDGARFLSGRI